MSKGSTDSVDYQKFRPHGRVNISIIDNQIAQFQALGPFNLELLGALDKIESKVLQKVKQKPWAEVIIFEQSCLATEEVFSAFVSHLKAQKRAGLSARVSALVFNQDIEGAILMIDKYKRCFEVAGLEYRHFENKEEAIKWAQKYI